MRLLRGGLTIVEMLVAMAAALLLLLATVQIFSFIGEGVNEGRSLIELSGQIRATRNRLREDLEQITVTGAPLIKRTSGAGYLSVIEGPMRDSSQLNPESREVANVDLDDVLAFTVASDGEPFTAYVNGRLVESHTAEIIWFVRGSDVNSNGMIDAGEATLYRRVIPLPKTSPVDASRTATLADFDDMRERFVGGVESTSAAIPDVIDPTAVPVVTSPAGEDVAIRNLVSFDVQVFDSKTPVRDAGAAGWVTAGHANFSTATVLNDATESDNIRKGGFVDLFLTREASGATGRFVTAPLSPIRGGGFLSGAGVAVWTTFPEAYEHDGIDQDGDSAVDEGFDGLDQNSTNGPDDVAERETQPPYPYPLRGLRVRIRVLEPNKRQVRQSTVTISFMPG